MKFRKHDIQTVDPETAERIMAEHPADWQMDRVLEKSLRRAKKAETVSADVPRRFSARAIAAFACAGLALAGGMTMFFSYRSAQNGYRTPIDPASAVEENNTPVAEQPLSTIDLVYEEDGITVFGLTPSKDGVEEFAQRAYQEGSHPVHYSSVDLTGLDVVLANLRAIRDNTAPYYNVTPKEITEKFGFRVFKNKDNCESYLLTENAVCVLGCGFGGLGTTSFAVADLDPSTEGYELYYTYSWGSGIHRSQVGVIGLADLSQPLDLDLNRYPYTMPNIDMVLHNENGRLITCVASANESTLTSFVDMNLAAGEKTGEFIMQDGRLIYKPLYADPVTTTETTKPHVTTATEPHVSTTTESESHVTTTVTTVISPPVQTTAEPQVSRPMDAVIFDVVDSEGKVADYGGDVQAFLALAAKQQLHLPDGDWTQIVPKEIEQKYDFRIFRRDAGISADCYLERNGRITKLGESFGLSGIGQLALADIDNNGTPELYYVYLWGSGITHLGLDGYDFSTDKVFELGHWNEEEIEFLPGPFSLYPKSDALYLCDHTNKHCDHQNGYCCRNGNTITAQIVADESGFHLEKFW